ncbi:MULTISPECIES: hypothetical protein [unclassified Mesorhizobium]|nr:MULTISPECIES: hypothetical protein [unclassified Mesorhizobium]
MTGYVYMTASQKVARYFGVANDLTHRMPGHKTGQGSRRSS